jgi:hypothetical protein
MLRGAEVGNVIVHFIFVDILSWLVIKLIIIRLITIYNLTIKFNEIK